MGKKVTAREVQYKHIYYENEVVLLGLDKDITEEELTIILILIMQMNKRFEEA